MTLVRSSLVALIGFLGVCDAFQPHSFATKPWRASRQLHGALEEVMVETVLDTEERQQWHPTDEDEHVKDTSEQLPVEEDVGEHAVTAQEQVQQYSFKVCA